jgi:hypothetical protein
MNGDGVTLPVMPTPQIAGLENVLNTVEISSQQPVTLPPACLPYSPEFVPEQAGRGAAALAQIAATSCGQERIEIPKLWNELPVKSRYVELAAWLLVAAAILFLREIFERRTGCAPDFWGTKRRPPTMPQQKNSRSSPKPARAAGPGAQSGPTKSRGCFFSHPNRSCAKFNRARQHGHQS